MTAGTPLKLRTAPLASDPPNQPLVPPPTARRARWRMRSDAGPASTSGRRPAQRALCAARALRVPARARHDEQPEASMTSLAKWVQAADPACAGLLKRVPVAGRGGCVYSKPGRAGAADYLIDRCC